MSTILLVTGSPAHVAESICCAKQHRRTWRRWRIRSWRYGTTTTWFILIRCAWINTTTSTTHLWRISRWYLLRYSAQSNFCCCIVSFLVNVVCRELSFIIYWKRKLLYKIIMVCAKRCLARKSPVLRLNFLLLDFFVSWSLYITAKLLKYRRKNTKISYIICRY